MTAEIVKVTPVEKYFSITWRITTRCNYDCMYCPTKWHDSTGVLHDLSKLQSAWQLIVSQTKHLNLPYKLSFSGGEVTINKNFLPFVEWIQQHHSDKIFSILLTTNGSASFNYYKKLFESVNNVSFSFHSEHANEKRFFDTVINLKNVIDQHKFLHVNIMDEHWNRDRIPHYVRILSDNNISYSINHVDYNIQTRTIPIFKGQSNLNV